MRISFGQPAKKGLDWAFKKQNRKNKNKRIKGKFEQKQKDQNISFGETSRKISTYSPDFRLGLGIMFTNGNNEQIIWQKKSLSLFLVGNCESANKDLFKKVKHLCSHLLVGIKVFVFF